jgi:hypothetical protein
MNEVRAMVMGSKIPEGILPFLFTDIEGSTRLWETAPEETSWAMARYDELVEKTRIKSAVSRSKQSSIRVLAKSSR